VTTPTTRPPRSARLRRLAPPLAGGLALGVALGLLAARRNPEDPWLVTVLVWALVTGPVMGAGLLLFVTDRAASEAASRAGAADVERAWSREASEIAFLTVMAGAVVAEGIGTALRVGWLAPVGLVHVLTLGFGSYAVSYLWLRHRGA
jgi:hypothetical protein